VDPTELDLNPLGLNFSLSTIAAGFIFGVIGFYLFRHAKKKVNYPLILISVLLMTFNMFTSNPWQDWGVGAVLCGIAYYMLQD
jgi:multisubunit Na+/H+ antiporter MnhE subunit